MVKGLVIKGQEPEKHGLTSMLLPPLTPVWWLTGDQKRSKEQRKILHWWSKKQPLYLIMDQDLWCESLCFGRWIFSENKTDWMAIIWTEWVVVTSHHEFADLKLGAEPTMDFWHFYQELQWWRFFMGCVSAKQQEVTYKDEWWHTFEWDIETQHPVWYYVENITLHPSSCRYLMKTIKTVKCNSSSSTFLMWAGSSAEWTQCCGETDRLS